MATELIDPFKRAIRYVRLSVTDRCDFRCSYCMPKGYRAFEEPEHWLSFDEIERVIGAFGALGVHRVRITGGEPLVRHGLAELASRLSALPGIDDLSLSTNASRLARLARPLRAAGVSRINVSLDSLRPDRFAAITGGGKLDKVIAGLMAAKAEGFEPIKINMVAMAGVNEDEIEDMVRFCIEHDFTLRLIETMPVGDPGRHASARYLSLDVVRQRLERQFDLVPAIMPGGGPARYAGIRGTDLKIGFITPISRHFCESCNRVRLAVDGTLHLCLGQDDAVALRPLLREGVSDQQLRDAIVGAIALKPERHEFSDRPEKVVRFMSRTGG
jgi:cyclic pyranopterin phosphate synthase